MKIKFINPVLLNKFGDEIVVDVTPSKHIIGTVPVETRAQHGLIVSTTLLKEKNKHSIYYRDKNYFDGKDFKVEE